MSRGLRTMSLGALVALGVWIWVSVTAATGRPVPAHQAYAQQCADPFPGQRDPANPLMLPLAPGSNPLTGASPYLFVNGPAHGSAAGSIAAMLGLDPSSFPDSYSWAQFKQDIGPGGKYSYKFAGHPQLAYDVNLLEKIADQPEPQRFSLSPAASSSTWRRKLGA